MTNLKIRASIGILGLMVSGAVALGADTRIDVDFFPAQPDAEATRPVTFSFDGKLYGDGLWFSGVAGHEDTLEPDERFLLEVVRVNASGSPDEVVGLWAPGDREELRATVADAEMFGSNQAFFAKVADSAFLAKIAYGPYVVFMVRHTGSLMDDFVHMYPMVRQDDGYALTNVLQDDPVLRFLFFVYRERLERELAAETPTGAQAASGK
jgi:hypothetical protein